MSEIIEFPSKEIRDWLTFEKSVRAALQEGGAKPAVIDVVLQRMKEPFRRYNRNFSFTLELPQTDSASEVDYAEIIRGALKPLEDQLHELMAEVIGDRMVLETRIAYLEGVGSND
jgi:hypothetical protein